MKSKYKPYLKYKESGVEWLGEIPEEWEVKRLKYLANIQTGTTPSTSNKKYFSDTDGIPWVKPDELNGFNVLIKSKKYLTKDGLKEARLIKAKSILVCGIGTIGKFGIAGVDLTTNQQINAVTFFEKIINNSFSKYLISSSKNEMDRFSNGNVVKILNTESHKNILYPYPPLQEQKAIATYLDRATQKIDALISKQEQLIALLKEKRQALISHAVTKGLNPDAKMKESGVEWLGEIPDGWEVSKLKYIARIQGGKDQKSVLDDNGEYPVYGSGGIFGYANQYLYNGESVLLGRKGTVDKPLYVNDKFWTVDTMYYTIAEKSTIVRWFYYVSTTINFDFYQYGSAVPSMTQEDLHNIHFATPSTTEQKAIATYLDQKTQAIDTLIDKATKSITLLKEKRTALISAVVTGKVDVRDEV